MEPEPKSGNAKYVVGIVIIAIIIVGISFFNRTNKPEIKNEPAAGAPIESAEKQNLEVVYTDENGFTPDNLAIRTGDTVTFVNKSTGRMWVGVDEHPTHMEYDGTNLKTHCAPGATPSFDQCASGAEYSFTFTKTGSWEYHNHARATMRGVVVVK